MPTDQEAALIAARKCVKIKEGNTDINDVWYYVTLFGHRIWDQGGRRTDVVPAANKAAETAINRVANLILAQRAEAVEQARPEIERKAKAHLEFQTTPEVKPLTAEEIAEHRINWGLGWAGKSVGRWLATIDALTAEIAALRDEGPGTPMSTVHALTEWAVRECGHPAVSSQPALVTVVEYVAALKQERDELLRSLDGVNEQYDAALDTVIELSRDINAAFAGEEKP